MIVISMIVTITNIFTIVLLEDWIGSNPINGLGTMKFVCTKRL